MVNTYIHQDRINQKVGLTAAMCVGEGPRQSAQSCKNKHFSLTTTKWMDHHAIQANQWLAEAKLIASYAIQAK